MAEHMATFPIGPNLVALMGYVMAEFSEPQRETMMATMVQRRYELRTLQWSQVEELVIALFCAPKNSIENPTYQH